MNRDRTVIVVLAVLLVASLALNWRYWSKSRAVPTPQTENVAAKARTDGPRESGESASFETVANPAMKGRLGRIVLNFADDLELNGHSTRTVVYAAGENKMLHTAYNVVAAELPPGKYDLEVSGKKIAGIPVESAKDTVVHSGVLRTHGSAETRFQVSDVGADNSIHVLYGNAAVGLPIGDYEITVSGQRDKFTIIAGKVTDY